MSIKELSAPLPAKSLGWVLDLSTQSGCLVAELVKLLCNKITHIITKSQCSSQADSDGFIMECDNREERKLEFFQSFVFVHSTS